MPGSPRLFTYSSGVCVFPAQSPHGRYKLQGASAVPHSALLGTTAVAASSIAQSQLLRGVRLLWSLWSVAAAYAVHAELSSMTHRPLPSVTKTRLYMPINYLLIPAIPFNVLRHGDFHGQNVLRERSSRRGNGTSKCASHACSLSLSTPAAPAATTVLYSWLFWAILARNVEPVNVQAAHILYRCQLQPRSRRRDGSLFLVILGNSSSRRRDSSLFLAILARKVEPTPQQFFIVVNSSAHAPTLLQVLPSQFPYTTGEA
ncbi:hypothetical protein JB92DRAFT_2833496 [Gautieria morchelliformis]|nr:hypothetical protein JB92DRAFT_2833496 [Gautieria morchelliformis]